MKWVTVLLLILISITSSTNATDQSDFHDWYTYQVTLPAITVKPVDNDKLILLARLISAEDGSQPFESNLWCGQTVFNYAKARGLTFYQSIYKPNRYYGLHNKVFKSGQYTKQSLLAAKMLLKGYRPAPENVLYFIGANDTDKQFIASVKPIRKIGYHIYGA